MNRAAVPAASYGVTHYRGVRLSLMDRSPPDDLAAQLADRLGPERVAAVRAILDEIEGPIELDEVDNLMSSLGEEAAASWQAVRLRTEQQEAQRQARDNWFDSLPLDEVKDLAIARLCDAEEALTQTPIDGTLASHGWNESFAHSMGAECARLRTHVETGTYDPAWGGSGLGRSLLDQVSPMAEDADHLHDAVIEAQEALRALSRQLEANR
jgi:hypothetical protein